MPVIRNMTSGTTLREDSVVYVGIDPSLTGFAIAAVCPADPEFYDVQVYSPKTRGPERLVDLAGLVEDFLRMLEARGLEVGGIAMETTVRKSFSASVLGELSGVVKVALWEAGRTPVTQYPLLVPPSTLKKFVSGKGNADKTVVMDAVRTRYGVAFPDDNAADAYVLARIAAHWGVTQEERAILTQLSDPKFTERPKR